MGGMSPSRIRIGPDVEVSAAHVDGRTDDGEDAAFDAIYPPSLQAISRRFWTPVSVARRAARLFRDAGALRVLDVGAGVGKFVLVAAAEVPEATFVGVEQREQLVEAARRAQERLGVSNASFVHGEASAMRWDGFQGFYFFNPLGESEEEKLRRDVAHIEGALRTAPPGTTVVTYHGMSGTMPSSYSLARSERAGSDWLRSWTKTRE
jgi:predicted RNA methylase